MKKAEQIVRDIVRHGALEVIGDGISIQDTDFRILYQNQAQKNMIGDHIGEYCYNAYEKKIKICRGCPLRYTLQDGKIHIKERVVSTDRGKMYVEIKTSSIKDDNGNIIAGIEVVRNITKRKLAEKALKDSEERYRGLFKSNPHPMWIYDLETLKFLEVNNAAIYYYGYTEEEFLSMTIKDIRPPEDIPRLLDNIPRSGDGFDKSGIWRHIKRDGSQIFVEITSHTMVYKGKPAEIVMAYDVTSLIETEEAIRKERDKAQNYLDIAGVIIVVLDNNGNVTLINKTGCEILGFPEDDIVGKNWFKNFLPERIRNDVSSVFEKLMEGKVDLVNYYENPILDRRGEERIIAWHNTILKDNKDIITGTLSSGEDITLRKKIEQELKDRVQELEQFYKMSIGRELKMKELKGEIGRLRAELREKSR
jgi:PAS domain S-box-containing protein